MSAYDKDGEFQTYLRERLRVAMTAALTCPTCDAPTFVDDPTDAESKWCFVCGRTEPLSANRSSDV